MSATINHVKLEGTDELMKNLRKLDSSIRGHVAKEAVEDGAYVIMGKAQINAPFRLGTLKNSFRVESRNIGSGAEAEVGPHVIYGRIQELGGWTGRGHKTYITGKHYLSRAVEEKKGEAVTAMAETIREYLNK